MSKCQSEDVVISTDVPIFATSKKMITYRGSYNATDEAENEMMRVRWNRFIFQHVFTRGENQKHIPPCGKCFTDFVLY